MTAPINTYYSIVETNFRLEISKDEGKFFHAIQFKDPYEIASVKELCQDETNMVSSIPRVLLIPTRTDFASLSSDLFSPLLSHLILKTKRTGETFFALVCFALDMVTLPIRLLTWIPRALYIANRNVVHPLILYLKEKGVPEALQKGILDITLIKEEQEKWTEEGKEHSDASKETITYHLEVEDHEVVFPSYSTSFRRVSR